MPRFQRYIWPYGLRFTRMPFWAFRTTCNSDGHWGWPRLPVLCSRCICRFASLGPMLYPHSAIQDSLRMDMEISNTTRCPLCCSEARPYHRDVRRDYSGCQNCGLVFVNPQFFMSQENELKAYEHHQNSPDDVGYRTFLSRLYDPMLERVAGESRGLDFGSGPGPTLSVMFEEQGYDMTIYDPFFAPDETVLLVTYDFVTATEVVEHFCTPKASLEKLWDCVRPGGYLGLMTKRVLNRERFSNWHYKNDDTHVCFYADDTFRWLARQWQASLEFVDSDVVIFTKPIQQHEGSA